MMCAVFCHFSVTFTWWEVSNVVSARTFHTFNLINYVKMKSFQLFLLMREEAMQQEMRDEMSAEEMMKRTSLKLITFLFHMSLLFYNQWPCPLIQGMASRGLCLHKQKFIYPPDYFHDGACARIKVHLKKTLCRGGQIMLWRKHFIRCLRSAVIERWKMGMNMFWNGEKSPFLTFMLNLIVVYERRSNTWIMEDSG